MLFCHKHADAISAMFGMHFSPPHLTHLQETNDVTLRLNLTILITSPSHVMKYSRQQAQYRQLHSKAVVCYGEPHAMNR